MHKNKLRFDQTGLSKTVLGLDGYTIIAPKGEPAKPSALTTPTSSSIRVEEESFKNKGGLTDCSTDIKVSNLKSLGYQPCHATHKPLVISVAGVDYNIYGGSCHAPVVKDYDILVGLDYGMPRRLVYPWHKKIEFMFPIKDMQVPTDKEEFLKLLEYLKVNLLAGKKIFVGCIGGHGRTGLVLSALVTYMMGEKDSITYVRANYCKKAVESEVQIKWLSALLGIKQVQATNSFSYAGYSSLECNFKKEKPADKLSSSGSIKKYSCVRNSYSIH